MVVGMTRQEEAYEYISETFQKLLQPDDRIGSEHRESVLAFWADLFTHEGVRNNMLLAFSGFMDEIDKRLDASRKAGIASVKEAIDLEINLDGYFGGTEHLDIVEDIIKHLLAVENTPEQSITVTDKTDLTEVGGGDEDDTPLL